MFGNGTPIAVEESADSISNNRSGSCRPIARRKLLVGAAIGSVLLGVLPGTAAAEPRGERKLALYNPHTDDRFDDVYRYDGELVQGSLHRINWLMRDFHRDQVAPIDPDLLDLLHQISTQLEALGPIQILSGYRTAATNRLLRREGFGAVTHSKHLQAKAADIRIDGVRLKHLRHAAISLRAGGVGTYRQDDFIHVDVGDVRVW
jgi:uncharacterized protein YcbK (DUF882 family)